MLFYCVIFSKLCIQDMTCFEPESCTQLVSGMEFHKFYFDHCKLEYIVSSMGVEKKSLHWGTIPWKPGQVLNCDTF